MLLAIHQKSQEPGFREVMDSFVLLAGASLAASRTLLQQLLSSQNFTLDLEDLSFLYNEKNDFYELWQQHNQLKTMEMRETWPDTFNEGHMHPFQIEPHLQNSLAAAEALTEFKDIGPWNILQMITKTIPISPRIVISTAMKQDILLLIWRKVNGNWDNSLIRIS